MVAEMIAKLIIYGALLLMYPMFWIILIREGVFSFLGIIKSIIVIISLVVIGLLTAFMLYYAISHLVFGEFKISWH